MCVLYLRTYLAGFLHSNIFIVNNIAAVSLKYCHCIASMLTRQYFGNAYSSNHDHDADRVELKGRWSYQDRDVRPGWSGPRASDALGWMLDADRRHDLTLRHIAWDWQCVHTLPPINTIHVPQTKEN